MEYYNGQNNENYQFYTGRIQDMIVKPEVLMAMNTDYRAKKEEDKSENKIKPGLPRPHPKTPLNPPVKKVNFKAVQETEKLRQKQQRQLKMNAMLSAQQASAESSDPTQLNP